MSSLGPGSLASSRRDKIATIKNLKGLDKLEEDAARVALGLPRAPEPEPKSKVTREEKKKAKKAEKKAKKVDKAAKKKADGGGGA